MQEKQPKVSIILTHYKAQKQIVECLRSINKFTKKVTYEIVIADNDEQNPIGDMIKKNFPEVKYHKAPYNLGFDAGNNFGAKYAKGEIFFFLNADTLFRNHVLEEMVAFMDARSDVGFVSPMLLDEKDKPYHLQGTAVLTPLRGIVVLSFLNKWFPNNPISKDYWRVRWNKKSVREIEVIPGTAMMVRAKVFKEVGKFDENFFIYFEEHDICKRALEKGYKNYIIPSAKLFHEWGVSTTDKTKFNIHFSDSRKYYFKKHFGTGWSVIVNTMAILGKKQLLAIGIGGILLISTIVYLLTK
jgi:GT2 family glycosyltransferase